MKTSFFMSLKLIKQKGEEHNILRGSRKFEKEGFFCFFFYTRPRDAASLDRFRRKESRFGRRRS